MAYYGFVSPGIKIITDTYEDIEDLITVVQYPKFIKTRTKDEAMEFVYRNTMEFQLKKLIRYGECFTTNYVKISYFIRNKSLYYNIYTDKFGRLIIPEENISKDMIIEQRNTITTIQIKNTNFDNNLILSHGLAIQMILTLLGSYIDVELVIPNHSVYYLFNSYTGNYRPYVRLIDFMGSRKGRVCFTMEEWG